MRYVRSLSAILLLSTCANPAPAESPCDYDSSVNTQYTKTIEKTSDFKKRVFPYVDDTRKCVINMNVTIDGKTYPTMGDFVFGPDISENSACKNAENRAKEMIIRKVSPEVLSANTDMKCTVKTEKIVEKEIEPIKETIIVTVPPIGSIVSSEIEIVKPHKVITYQDGFNSYVGDDSTIQLNATYQKGIITGIALELMRWIN